MRRPAASGASLSDQGAQESPVQDDQSDSTASRSDDERTTAAVVLLERATRELREAVGDEVADDVEASARDEIGLRDECVLNIRSVSRESPR